jgi:hypothetical protein
MWRWKLGILCFAIGSICSDAPFRDMAKDLFMRDDFAQLAHLLQLRSSHGAVVRTDAEAVNASSENANGSRASVKEGELQARRTSIESQNKSLSGPRTADILE